MGRINVRQLDDAVVERLKRRASRWRSTVRSTIASMRNAEPAEGPSVDGRTSGVS